LVILAVPAQVSRDVGPDVAAIDDDARLLRWRPVHENAIHPESIDHKTMDFDTRGT
jgi:hypothetical protein